MRCAGPFPLPQVAKKVVAGERPSVPPLSELHGPDKPPPPCYDAYCDLMR